MTEIREANFSLDLPGDWEQAPSDEEATLTFREVAGRATLAVTLLRVRPMFEIADKLRLLEDYLSHRQKFEAGKTSVLVHSEPVVKQVGETFEGEWASEDPGEERLIKHRVLLVEPLLADFAFESSGMEEPVFTALADAVLGSATATA